MPRACGSLLFRFFDSFAICSLCDVVISIRSNKSRCFSASTTMHRLSKHTRLEIGSRGSDIVAAGAPLEAIVAHALTSYQDHEARSKDAIRSACNLLSTSKEFRQAVLGCEGAVAVDVTADTPEAAAAFAGGHWTVLTTQAERVVVAGQCTANISFLLLVRRRCFKRCNMVSVCSVTCHTQPTADHYAQIEVAVPTKHKDSTVSAMICLFTCAAAWLAKRGHLLKELQLDFGRHPSDRAAAEAAVAAALQAAAAGSRTGSLHITSCKLKAAGPGSAAILQALPAGKLTSLEVIISMPGKTPADILFSNMLSLGQAFMPLQQLRQVKLSEDYRGADIRVGPALRHMSALTNLTSLTMPEV
jgi:hypothetical protein